MIDILLYRQWAISEAFANSIGHRVLELLSEGRSIANLVKKLSHEDLIRRYASLPAASEGLVVSTKWDSDARLVVATTRNGQNVALIPVLGALTKRGDLCSYGMRDYEGMINRANKAETISAIVLDVESPGGTVDGTNEFGLSIASSKKPVVVFGDGMVASAAYWAASQAREIVANKYNATEFGSIGVLYIHENYQAYIQKEIGSVEIIRAPQSVDKARVNVIEPLTEDLRASIEAELSSIAKEFFATVKAGRGERLSTGKENIFTGKMYPASQALDMGMIDALGTLQTAIDRASHLATSTTGSNPTQMKTKNLFSSFFTRKPKAAEEDDNSSAETPRWSDELTFNTDGSGDGAFCIHADADGKDRKFETKTDENQGNEPPTDPAVSEDDNWSVVAESNEAEDSDAKAKISGLEAEKADLQAQVTRLTSEKADLQKKLDAAPTGTKTTVIPKEETEAAAAADHKESATKKKSFRTPHDDEADAMVAMMYPSQK